MDACSRGQPSGLRVSMSPGAEASRRPLCFLPSEWVPFFSNSHGGIPWGSGVVLTRCCLDVATRGPSPPHLPALTSRAAPGWGRDITATRVPACPLEQRGLPGNQVQGNVFPSRTVLACGDGLCPAFPGTRLGSWNPVTLARRCLPICADSETPAPWRWTKTHP